MPGLYVTVAYLFAPYIIVDKNVDFWPAMEISRKKINKHWFGMAAFCVVLLAINIIACIPLFLGLFVTIPWTIYAVTIAYEDIFKEDSAIGTILQGCSGRIFRAGTRIAGYHVHHDLRLFYQCLHPL